MPPGAFRSASRRSDRSAIDCSRLSAMASKCCSSAAISAGSALAVRRSGRMNALVVTAFIGMSSDPRSLAAWLARFRGFWPRPAIMRHDPGLAASPHVRYRLKVEGCAFSLVPGIFGPESAHLLGQVDGSHGHGALL